MHYHNMAWKSLGKDAINKNTKPVSWVPRERGQKMVSFQVDPEFHDKLKEFAESSGLKTSQSCRYALAREMNGI